MAAEVNTSNTGPVTPHSRPPVGPARSGFLPHRRHLLRRRRTIVGLAMAVLLVAGGCRVLSPFGRASQEPARLLMVEATVGRIASTVSANGTVASPTQSRLTFKIGGRLKAVYVSVGQLVSEGEALARI